MARKSFLLLGGVALTVLPSQLLAQATGPRDSRPPKAGSPASQAESSAPRNGPAGNASSPDDQEIIVTATKRPEAVRSISGSVTALTGDQLQRLGADSMQQYLSRTPGVVFNATVPGNGSVVIRGVSTTTGGENGQGTTGIYINDIPLTDPALSLGTPDIDTFDVDNVVILRGPQGTLFGSSSLGGAVNYQATKPELDRWDAHFEGTLRDTRYGDVGGAGKIMLNAPLVNDRLGIRGVFVYRDDAGFIDNVGTGKTDANRTITKGGRVLVTWKPTDTTTLNYFYLEQHQNTRDAGYEMPALGGDLRKSTVFPEFERYTTLIHQLRLDQDLSFGTLTATATRHKKSAAVATDDTVALSPAVFGLAPVTFFGGGSSKGDTFEVRLASAPGKRFDYLIGAMYDRTRMAQTQTVFATGLADLLDLVGPGLGLGANMGQQLAPDDLLVTVGLPTKAKEMALFGEGTFHFDRHWKVTLGGRLFQQRLTNTSEATGIFSLLTQGAFSKTVSGTRKFSGFSPKGSITWTPDRNLMVYALVSKGYRFGGANLAVIPGIPASYGSDSLWNYEIGTRADLWQRKVSLDLTGFYIDWSNIQLQRQVSGITFEDNAGRAHIQGIESSVTIRPTRGFNLSSNITYLDAKLSKTFFTDPTDPAAAVFPKGTRLPGASKWQISNTISYEFLDSPLRPSLLLSHRYISRAPSQLEATSSQGGYNLFDARAGIELKKFSLTLFIENITDKRGIVTSENVPPLRLYVVRPRTIGITVDVRL